VLGLIAWLAACGSDAEPADRFEITGSVRDARSNAPIAKADVSFVSDALDQAEAASDADGHFSLSADVREGVLFGTLRASAAGYETSVAHSVYLDSQPHVIALELTPKASTSK